MIFSARQDIEDTFAGRSVAIVGSGPSCQFNADGFVDSHDVVVRVNNYKIMEGTGQRTDVFYSFFGSTIRKTAEELQRDGVKLCMNKYPNAKAIDSPWHDRRRYMRGIDFRIIYEEREQWWFCPTYEPTLEDFLSDFDLLGRHVPTTGFSAIREVLRCDPARVYLTGFDFFQSGFHNVNQKWRPMNQADPIRHEPLRECSWLRSNWESLPLEGDEVLRRAIGFVNG